MNKITVFIQAEGKKELVEFEIPSDASEATVHRAVLDTIPGHTSDHGVFIDDMEDELRGDAEHSRAVVKHGSTVHVTRCRRVKVTVHFTHTSAEHDFPPGARIKAVRHWAIKEFGIDHKDAPEHILKVCNSHEEPQLDTALHMLLKCHDCSLCFDLVPQRRVEGHA